tara:strand:- start:582 stop:884 length:303 start_codon:yes stop_codon:yes gene_type:complete
MNSFLKASVNTQLIDNNNIIDEKSINALYDGENLNISSTDNNENLFYIKLNNDEIMKLLAIPANPLDLEQRLKKDFKIRKNTRRRKKYRKKPRKLSKKSN